MFDILCVTNRALCNEDFLTRIEKVAASHPAGIILREKDLTEQDYGELAQNVQKICKKQGTPLIIHSFANIAIKLGCKAVHLPLPVLRGLSDEDRKMFTILGSSCHSEKEAEEAANLGCTYITAGHVFDTDCKKDMPGRGLEFLESVCKSVSVPVYAIGGISVQNIVGTANAGAKGACLMSTFMQCEEVSSYLQNLKKAVEVDEFS